MGTENTRLTADYLKECIDSIRNDRAYIDKAIDAIERIPQKQSDESNAAAIVKIVTARETTNQRLIGLLEKLTGCEPDALREPSEEE